MKRKKDTEIVCFFVFLLLRENSLLFSSSSTLSPPAPPLPLSAAPARGAVASLQDLLDLGKLPLLVAQRAVGARAQPLADAVQVEHVAAGAPGYAEPRVLGVACRRGVME